MHGHGALGPSGAAGLEAFTVPLRLPGHSGPLALLEPPGDAPLDVVAQRESVEVLPGRRTDLWAYRVGDAVNRSSASPAASPSRPTSPTGSAR